jgi:hypothetical protein
VVLYDLYDSDFNQVGGTVELSAAAEVDVTGGVSTVPEPRLALLMAFGLTLLIGWQRRKSAAGLGSGLE